MNSIAETVVQHIGPVEPGPNWLIDSSARTYLGGQTIIHAGSVQDEWIAISSGAVCLVTKVAGTTRVAVAALWLGDVIGWKSPLAKVVAQYDVIALVDVVTINIPWRRLVEAPARGEGADTAQLSAQTDRRLQDQIFMRLAGNGFQRLVSVLATLAAALASSGPRRGYSLALPMAQACLGQLSGLSRRQTWIYLGQLAETGWVTTSRAKVTLDGLPAWLALMAEVEYRGLACIASAELCAALLTDLAGIRSGGVT